MSFLPEHAPDGTICGRCGMHASKHRQRRGNHPNKQVKKSRIFGIDGEGTGYGKQIPIVGKAIKRKLTGQVIQKMKWERGHKYVYLAAIDENGEGMAISEKEVGLNPETGSLRTHDCLEFLCDLPARSIVFGFGFNYDITMMLQDLPEALLYLLPREKLRMRMKCENCKRQRPYCKCEGGWKPDGKPWYRPIAWRQKGEKHGFYINYMNRKLTVKRDRCGRCLERFTKCDCKKSGRGNYYPERKTTTVWDVFAFFQKGFAKTLKTWKIAPKEDLEFIEKMKDLRGTDQFKEEDFHAYCKKECHYLAQLGRALVEAHKAVDLTLTSFFGSGSTSGVLLKRWGIAKKRGQFPEKMQLPLACAFFGGRFENSFTGPYEGNVWDYDINSAYPYQTYRMPCLQCGHWRFVDKRPTSTPPRSERHTVYLVHWGSSFQRLENPLSWGTLPVRTPKTEDFDEGSIVFPIAGQQGWCWGEEWWAASQLNPFLEWLGAWVYETDCDCHPFQDVPIFYRERTKLGKDARGLVLKLGLNSLYGKLAQSRGLLAPYQSWVWAGLITSNTRAQLLRAVATATEPDNVLMLATDGVWSVEPMKLETPVDTGTNDCRNDKGQIVPLGGWSTTPLQKGVFCVRPGIYFPLSPVDDDEREMVRARGVGRASLAKHVDTIRNSFDGFMRNEPNERKMKLEVSASPQFVGIKTGITKSSRGVRKRDCFGDWIPRTINVSFDPRPKRRKIDRGSGRLETWETLPFESQPYDPAKLSPEAVLLKAAEEIQWEQPEAYEGDNAADFVDFDTV